jgi:hypothetical protein
LKRCLPPTPKVQKSPPKGKLDLFLEWVLTKGGS